MKHEDSAAAELAGTQLVRRMGHDFNNLFSIVLGGLSLLREEVGRGGWNDDSETVYRDIVSAAREATDVVARLTAWAGRQALDPEPVELGEVIREAVDAARACGARAVEVQPPAGATVVWADRAHLRNALCELLHNAADATGGTGSIRIGAGPGGAPAVSVWDDGHGMQPDELAACREPYFTTRSDLGRRGLGLSVVDGFTRASGGALIIVSEPGRGTHVTLKLPPPSD